MTSGCRCDACVPGGRKDLGTGPHSGRALLLARAHHASARDRAHREDEQAGAAPCTLHGHHLGRAQLRCFGQHHRWASNKLCANSAYLWGKFELGRGPGLECARACVQALLDTLELSTRIQKTPVVVGNCTGFAVNRVFFPYTMAACMLVSGARGLSRRSPCVTWKPVRHLEARASPGSPCLAWGLERSRLLSVPASPCGARSTWAWTPTPSTRSSGESLGCRWGRSGAQSSLRPVRLSALLGEGRLCLQAQRPGGVRHWSARGQELCRVVPGARLRLAAHPAAQRGQAPGGEERLRLLQGEPKAVTAGSSWDLKPSSLHSGPLLLHLQHSS